MLKKIITYINFLIHYISIYFSENLKIYNEFKRYIKYINIINLM